MVSFFARWNYLFLKQIVGCNGCVNAARVGVLLQTVCGYEYCVQSVFGFSEMGKCAIPFSQMFLVLAADNVFRLAVLHFAHIDYVVAAAEKQIYLCARPFGAIAVSLALHCPRADIRQHALNP